jgi:ABC-type sugar transport system substrate-binding protein/anti-anti-sigma regulatory factor
MSAQFSEQQQLYHDLANQAQQLHLLTSMLNCVGSTTDMSEVLAQLEDGLRTILPTSWHAIQIAIVDEQRQALQYHQLNGAGISRYWSNVRAGAQAAARMLGITLEYAEGTISGPEAQSRLLEQAIADHVDAIGLAPIDAAGLEPLISTSIANKIPLITFDSPPIAESRSLAYIGTNNYAAGILAGQALQRLLPQGGLIGVSLDSLTAANGRQRVEGLQASLQGSNLHILDPIEELFDPERGERLVCAALQQHPELIGGFGVCGGSGANWARSIERQQRHDLALICFDISADSMRMLKQGVVQVVLAQREYDMGFRTVELLCRVLVHGQQWLPHSLPSHGFFDTGVDVITLERSDWSICLADYLNQTSRQRTVDPQLRRAIARLPQPPRIRLIGMAEQGYQGTPEWYQPYESNSLISEVIEQSQAQIRNPQQSNEADPTLLIAKRRNSQTLAVIPLATRGLAVGVLILESEHANACGPSELNTLQQVAAAVAAVVEHVRLVAQIERRASELERFTRQQELLIETIREISSPAVPIVPGILVMPLVGVIDTQRATSFMETLMREIGQHRATSVLIDISAVPVVDTGVANYLIQAAQAARLLGAEVILVGISPAIAQTMVQLGIDLAGINTRADLAGGFAYALQCRGGRISYR